MRLGKFSQADGEKKRYTIDYTDWLDTGESVSAVAYAITPTTIPPLAVTGSAIDPSGLKIAFYVSGGLNQNQYKIVVTMTTSAGQIKEDSIVFAVNNP